MFKRRDILSILGASAAASVAVAAEDVSTIDNGWPGYGLALPGKEVQNKIAASLEKLAASIRSGEVSALGLDIHSKVRIHQWMEHMVTVKLEIPGIDDGVTS